VRAPAGFAELPGEVERLLRDGEARRVAVVLIDAFGWAFVERHLDHPLLRRCARDGLLAPMAAQFPSTTTAHVTTMHSGLPVGEHGLYEWRVLEPSAGRAIVPLTSSWADEGPPDGLRAAGVPPEVYVPGQTLYARLAAHGVDPIAIEPAAFCPSTYDEVALRGASVRTHTGLPDAAAQLAAALAAPGDAPRYVVAYADEVDGAGHAFGPAAPEFAAASRAVLDGLHDALLGPDAPRFAPGTLVLLTADHGQVDVHPERADFVDLLWPELPGLLRRGAGGRPLSAAGSARDLFLHVEPEHVGRVVDGLQERLGDRATVHAAADLVTAGWFGPRVGPRLQARLAEVCVLPAAGRMAWWSTLGGGVHRFRGHHGGRTPDEQTTFLGALRLG
jgi:hypothetical protein